MNNGTQNKTESVLERTLREELTVWGPFKDAMNNMVNALNAMNTDDRSVALELLKTNMETAHRMRRKW